MQYGGDIVDRTEFLIVGAGIAGFSCAKTLRSIYPDAMITVVSKFKDLDKYKKRLLSASYDSFTEKEAWLDSLNWYFDNNIELLLAKEIAQIDEEASVVKLTDGNEIAYKKMLISTGSRVTSPLIPFKDIENIIVIKTAQDMILEEFVNPQKITIVGLTSFSITEAISLRDMGKEVSIIERGKSALYPMLNDIFSNILIGHLNKLGIKVYMADEIEEIKSKDKKIDQIITKNGQIIDTDLLVYNKGIKANIEFAFDSGLDYDIGLITDKYLKTSAENIFAAGDCVEFDSSLVGMWEAAYKQGRIAGLNMAGGKKLYRYPNESKILSLKDKDLFSFGQASSDKNFLIRENLGSLKGFFYDKPLEDETKKLMGITIFGDIYDRDEYVEEILLNTRR